MKGKKTFTQTEADAIIELIREKLQADPSRQKGIRAKIRKLDFYASEFGLTNVPGGYTEQDFLRVVTILGRKTSASTPPIPEKKQSPVKHQSKEKKDSDESYVIDLCDEVLGQKALRQHRFDFLRGDAGTRLPVDAWYPELNLVVEYMERQHTESVKFFDRRQTVSGVGRGEQRRLYDQRRQEVLPQQGISLLTFHYHEFEHTGGKKLKRIGEEDRKVIGAKLKRLI